MRILSYRLSALALTAVLPWLYSAADTTGMPVAFVPDYSTSMIVAGISNNGLWGISETAGSNDGDIRPAGGTLINLQTRELTTLHTDANNWAGATDVADDATVVGEYNGYPAYWSYDTDSWTTLPVPDGYAGGRLLSVTPDAKWAVGYVNEEDNIYAVYPALYNLETNEYVSLSGLPTKDMVHEDKKQNCFMSISADGRYIVGQMSGSYLLPISLFSYVYDVESQTYDVIGYTEHDTADWMPVAGCDDMLFIDYTAMSPSGEWVTGAAYVSHYLEESAYFNEYRAAFRYNVLTKEFELFDGDNESDIAGTAITDEGVVLGATPAENPYPTMVVRYGNHFYTLDMIFSQVYGFDLAGTIGETGDVTGKPCAVSSDGLTLSLVTSTTGGYILQMPESLTDAAARVNLLAAYTASPAEGSVMTKITDVKVKFEQNISFVQDADYITIQDEEGNDVKNGAALKVRVDGTQATISFRTLTMDAGKTYYVNIPAGAFTMPDDRAMKNAAIRIAYVGREDGPVAPTRIYPADGASVARIDASTQMISITFDATLQLTDGLVGYLSREGEDEPYCQLVASIDDKTLYLYPVTTQYLYNGTNYIVNVPEGIVTDLSGQGANEAIELHYIGTYERTWAADDMYLFNEDATSYDNFMWYDGDQLTPATVPAGWGFYAGLPWLIVRSSNEVTDMAFAATSMYSPAGKADDWMVTPQLYLPDENCYLTFKAQSYLKAKTDVLSVYIYPCDKVYNTLTANIVDDIRAKGALHEYTLSPGDDEEGLEDDWVVYNIDLSEYSGEEIYIAFVNQNEDQSAVFVDDIQVIHNMKYLTTFEHSTRVVGRSEQAIRGSILINNPTASYSTLSMTLADANDNVIDEIHEDGLSLSQGDTYRFAFEKALPLEAAAENKFTVTIALDDDVTVLHESIYNLAFEPTKRVVIEEYTGSDCGNCPQGIEAIAYIEKMFPGHVLPVTLRCYNGDVLGQGVQDYATYLGLSAAPSAIINRSEEIYYPMISADGDYRFSATGVLNSDGSAADPTWLDVVRDELEVATEADIDFEVLYDEETGALTIPCKVRYAISTSNRNISLLGIVLEDNLTTYQQNYFSSSTDEDLGEWAAGGIYGSSVVYPVTFDDVARGTVGETFDGTGGLLPTSFEGGETYEATLTGTMPSVSDVANCKVVVMMIDANTDAVINANRAAVGASGISLVGADKGISISATKSSVIVKADGLVNVQVYDLRGRLIAQGASNGELELGLGAYRGVAIVKASTASSTHTAKLSL